MPLTLGLDEVCVGLMGPSPDKIAGPGPWVLSVCNEIALEPMNRVFDGPKETGVPATVVPGPPGEIVVPSMAKPVGFAVNTWLPTVNTSKSW